MARSRDRELSTKDRSGIPRPRSDLGGLQAFVAVARSGSVSAAARLLDRTQPSISARLAALESVWNTRLFPFSRTLHP